MTYVVPADAEYYIIKGWHDDFDDDPADWTQIGIDEGDTVYYRLDNGKLRWWKAQDRKWILSNINSLEALAVFDEDGKVRQVISTEIMAEMTVRIAQVIREFGYECRFNESLNCLQYSLVKEYFNDWLSQPVAAQSGAYQYWEDAHQRAGISRSEEKK